MIEDVWSFGESVGEGGTIQLWSFASGSSSPSEF